MEGDMRSGRGRGREVGGRKGSVHKGGEGRRGGGGGGAGGGGVFFFKQKTAYEIKECDWSSDVCSSDLPNITLRERDKSDRSKCPYKTEGNLTADLIIKYIDSPYCVWCWIEEPVLKKMIETKGDLFKDRKSVV